MWQARYRAAAAIVLGVIGVVLRAGHPTAPAVVGLALLYGGVVIVTTRAAMQRADSGRWLRHVVPLADLGLIYGLVALLASPVHYERALVLSIFSVLLAQLYYGTGPAVVAFRTSIVAYALLLVGSDAAGATLDWAESILSLALYALGGGIVAAVHASRQRRLASLAQLFERLEEGDFAHAYDASLDPRPDSVTVMGRAYDRMRLQLASIVLTDPLSGCLNRRGFEQHLHREIARAERHHAELALVAVDIDRFKRINDELGHLAGDATIRNAGALLRESARAGDVVARTGGEEFVLILPETDVAGARAVADRIVAAFRAHDFVELDERRVTVSVGVAVARVTALDVGESLKARADEALYSAKRSGRDRVMAWEPPMFAASTGSARD